MAQDQNRILGSLIRYGISIARRHRDGAFNRGFNPTKEIGQFVLSAGREWTDAIKNPEVRAAVDGALQEFGTQFVGAIGGGTEDMTKRKNGGDQQKNGTADIELKVLAKIHKMKDAKKSSHLRELLEKTSDVVKLFVCQYLDTLQDDALTNVAIETEAMDVEKFLDYLGVESKLKERGVKAKVSKSTKDKAYENIRKAGEHAKWVLSALGDSSSDEERDAVLETVSHFKKEDFDSGASMDPESQRRRLGVYPKLMDFVAGIFGRSATAQEKGKTIVGETSSRIDRFLANREKTRQSDIKAGRRLTTDAVKKVKRNPRTRWAAPIFEALAGLIPEESK
ncbi:MAG: hypothetical protein V1668_00350 [Patescibacteria group bacterium]